ncbi:hypothetical protein [Streptomyces sp. NPDC051546]|uniref:hypothetical protein n=1 Tax=Streptomyces sp. NPDC051546 TaxID=3365655 RepID=UPI0037914FBD
MGLFRSSRANSNTGSESSRYGGRTASEVENETAERGSTGEWTRGSYVEQRSTGGWHRHDPGSDGRYRCACGC